MPLTRLSHADIKYRNGRTNEIHPDEYGIWDTIEVSNHVRATSHTDIHAIEVADQANLQELATFFQDRVLWGRNGLVIIVSTLKVTPS
jgi:hypothetical protein